MIIAWCVYNAGTMTRASGFVLLFTLATACGQTRPDVAVELKDTSSYLEVLPLTNEEYSIVEMATAHGAFTVEVEVVLGADTDSIARRLVEPVQDRYAEVLVYFYDRASDGELPLSRVQWTAENGYVKIEY